jgi:hypothetical protein
VVLKVDNQLFLILDHVTIDIKNLVKNSLIKGVVLLIQGWSEVGIIFNLLYIECNQLSINCNSNDYRGKSE